MKAVWAASLMAGLFLVSACGDVTPASKTPIPSEGELAKAAESRTSNPLMPRPWWREFSKKSQSFYLTDEAINMAENMITWQNQDGGWPLMVTWKVPKEGAEPGPWGAGSALVKSTVNEIRFLARAYNATKDERYKQAAIDGLDFIIDQQYANGGWPHGVNGHNPYDINAGYNDDEIPDLLTLLQEVLSSPEYGFLEDEKKQDLKTAFTAGLQFVLDTQIEVNGFKTAWAQQYDKDTLKPTAARAFEPAAISGGESAEVLRFLMSIPKPSDEVKAAIEAGVKWYADVQLDGLSYERGNGDSSVTPKKGAPPLWARLYEIESMEPIFAGRDGLIRYNLSEIEKERRGGYAWYNYNGTKVFRWYADWKKQREWDNQPPANIDESKVASYALPPLLTAEDGSTIDSVEAWETVRRPQIMELLANYQEGHTPTDEKDVRINEIERDGTSLDGLAKRTQVRIEFPDADDLRIRVVLLTPADAADPVPTLLYLSFTPNVMMLDEPGMDEDLTWSGPLEARVPDRDATRLGAFDAKRLIERGYGVAHVYYGDIYPDFDHGNAEGVTKLFGGDGNPRAPEEWGAIGGWAWGLSRVMDYLQTDPSVDGDKVALAGVSRLGKATLWAGAQDQRFAAVIPWLSGEGGAAISRRNYGETVADLTNPKRYDYWFAPTYQDYAFKVDELPVDGHMLLSMLAPRPTLLITGSKDTWSDPKGEWVSAQAAKKVWELYGLSGPVASEEPPLATPVWGDLSYFMHDGEHTVLPPDYDVILDFLDRAFADE